jgi:hypothetical protein
MAKLRGNSWKMKKIISISLGLALITIISGCGEEWVCQTKGKTMFSMSSSGKIGSADKGCTCNEIRNFELQQFGRVDEEALKNDFGC